MIIDMWRDEQQAHVSPPAEEVWLHISVLQLPASVANLFTEEEKKRCLPSLGTFTDVLYDVFVYSEVKQSRHWICSRQQTCCYSRRASRLTKNPRSWSPFHAERVLPETRNRSNPFSRNLTEITTNVIHHPSSPVASVTGLGRSGAYPGCRRVNIRVSPRLVTG